MAGLVLDQVVIQQSDFISASGALGPVGGMTQRFVMGTQG
jgi:hypothetical protein